MKHYVVSLFAILVSSYLYSQDFPKGSWTIVTDNNGNIISAKASVPRRVTIFNFQDATKYSFSYEEIDSLGRKTVVVKESGMYSVTASQFVLTPKSSTTSFYDYLPQSTRPIGNSVRQNSLSDASYRWIYQNGKMENLTIETAKPGYREGFISQNAKAYRPLPAATRSSLARSM